MEIEEFRVSEARIKFGDSSWEGLNKMPEKTDKEKYEAFTLELSVVINKHGVDNEMGVPDFILATFIINTILSLKQTMGMMKDFYDTASEAVKTESPTGPRLVDK